MLLMTDGRVLQDRTTTPSQAGAGRMVEKGKWFCEAGEDEGGPALGTSSFFIRMVRDLCPAVFGP